MTNQIKTITIQKNLKTVVCGTITPTKDQHGNKQFFADRVVDGDQFTFWTAGAAKLWLKLGGFLHG